MIGRLGCRVLARMHTPETSNPNAVGLNMSQLPRSATASRPGRRARPDRRRLLHRSRAASRTRGIQSGPTASASKADSRPRSGPTRGCRTSSGAKPTTLTSSWREGTHASRRTYACRPAATTNAGSRTNDGRIRPRCQREHCTPGLARAGQSSPAASRYQCDYVRVRLSAPLTGACFCKLPLEHGLSQTSSHGMIGAVVLGAFRRIVDDTCHGEDTP